MGFTSDEVKRFNNYCNKHRKEINKHLKRAINTELNNDRKQERFGLYHYDKYKSQFPQADILFPDSYPTLQSEYLADCETLHKKDKLYYIIKKANQKTNNHTMSKELYKIFNYYKNDHFINIVNLPIMKSLCVITQFRIVNLHNICAYIKLNKDGLIIVSDNGDTDDKLSIYGTYDIKNQLNNIMSDYHISFNHESNAFYTIFNFHNLKNTKHINQTKLNVINMLISNLIIFIIEIAKIIQMKG